MVNADCERFRLRYCPRVRRVLVAVLGLFVLCAGCGPTAANGPAAPSASQPTARPAELVIDDVDPCALLTPAQQRVLGIGARQASSSVYSAVYERVVTRCVYSDAGRVNPSIGLGLVVGLGIERLHDPSLRVHTTPTDVSGFPALTVRAHGATDYCTVVVDVATARMLEVQVDDTRRAPPVALDSLCLASRRAAEAAVATLRAG